MAIMEKTVFDKTGSSAEECLNLAQNEPIYEGKTFWEAEPDMEWFNGKEGIQV